MQFSKVRLNWSQTTSKFLKPCVLLAGDIQFVCSAHRQPGRAPSSCVLTLAILSCTLRGKGSQIATPE